jgi:hypothetical protein
MCNTAGKIFYVFLKGTSAAGILAINPGNTRF